MGHHAASEREAFLEGLAAQRESTSMSTMVQIISDETQPAIEPTQPPPIEEAPEQTVEASEEGPEQLVETAAEDSDQPEDQPRTVIRRRLEILRQLPQIRLIRKFLKRSLEMLR